MAFRLEVRPPWPVAPNEPGADEWKPAFDIQNNNSMPASRSTFSTIELAMFAHTTIKFHQQLGQLFEDREFQIIDTETGQPVAVPFT